MLYFIPPKDCGTIGRALAQWQRLLSLYDFSVGQARADGTRRRPSAPSECPFDAVMARTVGVIALNTAAHLPAGSGGQPVNLPSITELRGARARLETSPAYGILKSSVDSGYTPAEIIEVLTPASYQHIRTEEAWNGDTPDRYTLLTSDICDPARQLSPSHRCQNLRKTGGDQVNDYIDDKIRNHPASDGPLDTVNGSATEEDNLNQRRRLILIQVSPDAPDDPFVVAYRDGIYFYIAKGDPTSQRNFALLQLLVSVQANAPTAAPQQTITVGAH